MRAIVEEGSDIDVDRGMTCPPERRLDRMSALSTPTRGTPLCMRRHRILNGRTSRWLCTGRPSTAQTARATRYGPSACPPFQVRQRHGGGEPTASNLQWVDITPPPRSTAALRLHARLQIG